MRPILTTLTAAAALVGVGTAAPTPASANPLVIAPLAAAAILGGTAIGGVAVGAAVTHPAVVPVPAAPAAYPSYAAAEPVVPGCYYTHARVRGAWHRVQVCD
jgi:hypothetical protein